MILSLRYASRIYSTSALATSSAAWETLTAKVKDFRPTEAQLKVIQNERPFALAEEVVAHTIHERRGNRTCHQIYLQWIGKPELDVRINLDNTNNMYSTQVYAVYYAMVWAHYQKRFFISLYTHSEIVFKCATGKFKIKVQKNVYEKIQRNLGGEGRILRARLSLLTPTLAKEKNIEKSPKSKALEVLPIMEEMDFRNMVDSSIGVV